MNRTQLIDMTYYNFHKYDNVTRDRQLYNCTAWLSSFNVDNKRYTVLRSYNTLVALYSHVTNVVYKFDYYSATTSQHVGKFAVLMKAKNRINLYADSHTSKKTRLLNELNDYSNLILED